MRLCVLVLALVLLPGLAAAQPPAKTTPTGVCKCVDCRCGAGVRCKDSTCPFVSGDVPNPMLTAEAKYAAVYAAVKAGKQYVMAVGVSPPPTSATATAAFPKGFMGIRDGLYSCTLQGGKPVMVPYYGFTAGGCANGSCGVTYGSYAGPQNVGQRLLYYYPAGGGCANGNCQIR